MNQHRCAGIPFLSSGSLTIGANCWASHAGPHMWRKWGGDVVARDFSRLASAGVKLLRVFPIWPDFQPIHALVTGWMSGRLFVPPALEGIPGTV